MDARTAMLLSCPYCRRGLFLVDRTLRCPVGHAFDLARSGYANLAARPARFPGDTTPMLAARARVLARGVLDVVSDVVVSAGADWIADRGAVVDLGAGNGHHTALLLSALGDRDGLALDVSVLAAKRSARAHPRLGAVVCDVWDDLPVRDGVAGLVCSVFAPRNPRESSRILGRGGRLVIVTPTHDHLRELVEPLGMVAVDPRKDERLADSLDDDFTSLHTHLRHTTVSVTRELARDLATMGPSAYHLDDTALDESVARLPDRLDVTIAVRASVYAPR